jgi:SAM-dependent methyltransferase
VRPDITALADYYASTAGRRLHAAVAQHVTPLLRRDAQSRLLALGFAEGFLPSAGPQIVHAAPALQGVRSWPGRTHNKTCMVDDKHLPFADSLFDQVLLVHALEYAEPARRMLRELWRVLAPAGQIILLVPNRRSLHTLLDPSPFANGRPYSAPQLEQLLQEAMFEPQQAITTVALPGVMSTRLLDRLVLRALPNSGGIHIVLAQKTDGIAPARAAQVQRQMKAQLAGY